MNKTAIEWCDYTWNPVTGCKRGCSYCYAKRIYERFNEGSFTEIVFHPDRLDEPSKVKKPSIVFVGSMSDIEYWSLEQIERVIQKCREYSWHTFMFLTKDANSYKHHVWPENTMQGLTLERLEKKENAFKLMHLFQHSKRPFLSVEPLLGKMENSDAYGHLEKIIVGAMTGRGSVVPKKEWIDSLVNIPKEKLFLKSNIKKYMKGET